MDAINKIMMFIIEDCLPFVWWAILCIMLIIIVDKFDYWLDERFPRKEDKDKDEEDKY